MGIDEIFEFILNGSILDVSYFFKIKYESIRTRTSLSAKFPDIKGLNKKNGAYEILRKDNVLFYCGFGGIGRLRGIGIKNIVAYGISATIIQNFLKQKQLNYLVKNELEYKVENGVYLFFEIDETTKEKYLKQTIIADNWEIVRKLRKTEIDSK